MKNCCIVLAILTLFASCHKDEPEPEITLERLTVVYIIAENSLSSFADFDISEMRKAMGSIPDSCKLAIYIDESSNQTKPRIITMDATEGEQTIYQYQTDPISTDSATMQQALSIIMEKCPARHYGLVLWSHGSGWIPPKKRRTIGIDNGRNSSSNDGSEMNISTLANVLQKTNVHWDYIFFDACFMQGVEVAYELRNVTDWCIGSPAEIPGNGAPYDYIMTDLFRPSEEAWRISEDYYNYYQFGTGLVISAITTSELEELAAATAPFVTKVDTFPSTDGIQVYRNPDDFSPQYHDMGSAMHKWLTEAEYQEWKEAMNRAVPHHYATDRWMTQYFFDARITDPENVISMSMYIPVKGHILNAYYKQTSWWKRMNQK